jgi:hypothetical protein
MDGGQAPAVMQVPNLARQQVFYFEKVSPHAIHDQV